MSKYFIEVTTHNNETIQLGWVKAQNGWHALNIANKIAIRLGYDVKGVHSSAFVINR